MIIGVYWFAVFFWIYTAICLIRGNSTPTAKVIVSIFILFNIYLLSYAAQHL